MSQSYQNSTVEQVSSATQYEEQIEEILDEARQDDGSYPDAVMADLESDAEALLGWYRDGDKIYEKANAFIAADEDDALEYLNTVANWVDAAVPGQINGERRAVDGLSEPLEPEESERLLRSYTLKDMLERRNRDELYDTERFENKGSLITFDEE